VLVPLWHFKSTLILVDTGKNFVIRAKKDNGSYYDYATAGLI